MSDDVERLIFRCSCGEEAKRPEAGPHLWPRYVGFGGQFAIRWHQTEQSVMAADAPYDLLDVLPTAGEVHWVRLQMPFTGAVGEAFWALCEPPMIVFNGIIGAPEDIPGIGLVAGRLLDWRRVNDNEAVGRVEVLDVVPLAELAGLPARPVGDPGGWLDSLRLGQTVYAERNGDYLAIDSSVEGDDGIWAVFDVAGGSPRLLLLSEWGAHTDIAWAGNGALSETQAGVVLGLGQKT